MLRCALTRRNFLEKTYKLAGAALAGTTQLLFHSDLHAQTDAGQVTAVLNQPIQTSDVVEFQLRQYLMKRVPALPTPANATEWTKEEGRLRKHVLENVIFHGWPKDWVNSGPKFEDAGVIASGSGYRMRKLRYQIVPGFWSTAILYEPEKLTGKVPAILNLNGHAPEGKAAEYKQKRCINYALQGMLALSLEWLGMGELNQPENSHWFGAHLNLAGASAAGLFYLAMRPGLDYLYAHENTDRARIGVTGLSGGAWQTIVLSALDERVSVAIPISGYFSLMASIERTNSDVGDIEYNPPDLCVDFDYTVLTAMRAPRPTLLIYSAEDEYGILAPLEKPYLFDDIKPFYKLYGKESDFVWYENTDPGTHNYQLDNRKQSYAFFSKHFGMPPVQTEIPVDSEIKTYEELVVGLPKDNLTILGLAKTLAERGNRRQVPKDAGARATWAHSARENLRQLVRYNPAKVSHAWHVTSTRKRGLESISYRFEFNNGLSATCIVLKATTASEAAPLAIVLDDNGMQIATHEGTPSTAGPAGSASQVAWHANRGRQVGALNLIFTGDASPDKPGVPKDLWPPSTLYSELLSVVGDRPLGIETAQLIGATKWLLEYKSKGSQQAFLESNGIRSQVVALMAAAMDPSLYSEVVIHNGMKSLNYLLHKPVTYQDAPELFCLDLYKEFDIDDLISLAEPTKVTLQPTR